MRPARRVRRVFAINGTRGMMSGAASKRAMKGNNPSQSPTNFAFPDMLA
jgi:hypothetical protein